MIRKPLMHYGISTKGIKFRERWNIVEMATEQEFKEYIKLEKKTQKLLAEHRFSTLQGTGGKWNWNYQSRKENSRVQQRYLRNIWRVRYGNQFNKDQLYRIDKKIHRYNCKISPTGGNGVMSLWTLRHGASNIKGLHNGNIVVYSHTDELGMHYFTRVDQIDAAHMYVFKPSDHQLCAIVPLEET